MDRKELIKRYIDFFKSKDHKEIANASLIPENDPTVLFTTAGMHPLVPFLLGEKHPQGKRLVGVQRCIRTGDIEEVGDAFHLSFFEMLGNWSLGDYWKKETIEYSFEFLTKILKIPKGKIEVTCFKGDSKVPKDDESSKVWKGLGIKSVKFLGRKDNWWDPAGETGPCGPDTEMFVNGSEIWNDVFMQYNKDGKGNYKELKEKNVDTGMGVERMLAILEGKKSVYETSVFLPIIKEIEKLSGKKDLHKNKDARIIADHIKAAVFIIGDGIVPKNTEQGYVLRRLVRRAIVYGRKFGLSNFTTKVAEPIFSIYKDYDILKDKSRILEELNKEEENFMKTLEQGMKVCKRLISTGSSVKGKDCFLLYQSYGLPIEVTKELAKEKKVKVDEAGFKKEEKKHQELSRTATKGKFKSGLADNTEATTKLHTATHLLNQSLRVVLNKPDIFQRGSNITPERLRFDFNFDRKLMPEELKKVEDLVNDMIKEDIVVLCKETSLDEAKKIGAKGVFDSKYGKKVKVFTIGDFSTEICAGPHVESTGKLGTFKIKKEESSSAGVRRIKAVLE
jgi:alanyl-tRNA synthetase